MTRIEHCHRCGRRLVVVWRGLCKSCSSYHKGVVTPNKQKNVSVPA